MALVIDEHGSVTGLVNRFTVVDVERNRISKVKIEKAPVPVKA